MEINATLSTSSKYLGLSVGCNLVGGIEIKFASDDSTVQITNLPTIYMKSILTNPWLELGGRTNISYNGLSGYVLFQQKPVYSSGEEDLHKVIGYCGEEQILFGQWNRGYTVVGNAGNGEHWVDFQDLARLNRFTPRIVDCCGNESRVVWKNVTKSLLKCDFEEAQRGKNLLEHCQREIREKTEAAFGPKFFRVGKQKRFGEVDMWVLN